MVLRCLSAFRRREGVVMELYLESISRTTYFDWLWLGWGWLGVVGVSLMRF